MRAHFSRLPGILALLASLPGASLSAQTLQLSAAAASRGANVEIKISLKSPPGKGPAAVQWEAIIPAAQLSLSDVAIGPAAREAGKSVSCAVKGRTESTLTSVCILAGGRQELPSGPIALLRLRVSPQASLGAARIRVERAIAVSKDATEVPMKPVETVVSVRAKPIDR
jgi:hypothetical protein